MSNFRKKKALSWLLLDVTPSVVAESGKKFKSREFRKVLLFESGLGCVCVCARPPPSVPCRRGAVELRADRPVPRERGGMSTQKQEEFQMS